MGFYLKYSELGVRILVSINLKINWGKKYSERAGPIALFPGFSLIKGDWTGQMSRSQGYEEKRFLIRNQPTGLGIYRCGWVVNKDSPIN
jgi:hypothetical protein